jgi:hypothetical protein
MMSKIAMIFPMDTGVRVVATSARAAEIKC